MDWLKVGLWDSVTEPGARRCGDGWVWGPVSRCGPVFGTMDLLTGPFMSSGDNDWGWRRGGAPSWYERGWPQERNARKTSPAGYREGVGGKCKHRWWRGEVCERGKGRS